MRPNSPPQTTSVSSNIPRWSKSAIKLLKKVAFAGLLLNLSAAQLERSGLMEGVERSKLFGVVRKLSRVTDFLGKLGSKKPSADKVKEGARGLLERLKRGDDD